MSDKILIMPGRGSKTGVGGPPPIVEPGAKQPEASQPPAPGGARKYVGAVAEGYDAKREQSSKWIAEQAAVEEMLDDLPANSRILDIPIGTGRFIDYYRQRHFIVTGLDISEDMLRLARQKVGGWDETFRFGLGNVLDLGIFEEMRFDAAVMVRLTRWLSPEDCTKAMQQLARVTHGRIIFTHRVNGEHPRPLDLFLMDGWLTNEREVQPGYYVTRMERA